MQIRSGWLTFVLIAVACLAAAQNTQPTQNVADSTVGAAPTNPLFEKMKTLVGDWQDEEHKLKNTFRIVGDGSAVLHIETPEGEQEIITLFYPVSEELRADHYCFARNQPRYVAAGFAEPNVIAFQMRDITNLHTLDMGHMNATTWKFVDANHLTQEWRWKENGKEEWNTLNFTRVK